MFYQELTVMIQQSLYLVYDFLAVLLFCTFSELLVRYIIAIVHLGRTMS
jgi:hypothetical protein